MVGAALTRRFRTPSPARPRRLPPPSSRPDRFDDSPNEKGRRNDPAFGDRAGPSRRRPTPAARSAARFASALIAIFLAIAGPPAAADSPPRANTSPGERTTSDPPPKPPAGADESPRRLGPADDPRHRPSLAPLDRPLESASDAAAKRTAARPDLDREFSLAQKQRTPRDTRRERLLATALAARDAGRLDEAADLLGQFLAAADDTFLPVGDARFPKATRAAGLRRTVFDLIAADPALRAVVAERSEVAAAALLPAALDGDADATCRLRTVYPFAPATATLRVATAESLLTAGLTDEAAAEVAAVARASTATPATARAARRLNRALASVDRVHRTASASPMRPIEPAVRTVAYVTQSKVERPLPPGSTSASGSPAGFATSPPRTPLPWTRWVRSRIADAERTPAPVDALGSPAAADACVADEATEEAAVRQWESERSETQGSYAGPQVPLVMQGTVVCCNHREIIARSLADGSVVWRYARTGTREAVRSQALFDAVHLRLSAAGSLVFFVESDEAGKQSIVALQTSRPQPTVAWRYAPSGGTVLGPPLPTPHGLVALVRDRTQLQACGLTVDGRVRFVQPIAFGDVPAARKPLVPPAAEPVYAGGLAICPTRLGTTVAIDARDGSLAWVDYDPTQVSSRNDRPANTVNRLHGEAAYPTPCVVADGTVVSLPPDSPLVHGIDLETGVSKWRIDRRDDTCLVGVAGGSVFLTGTRSARAIELRTGRTLWTQRIATPTGRGCVIGATVAVPQPSGELIRLSTVDGRLLDEPYRAAALRDADRALPMRHRRIGSLVCVREALVWASPTTIGVHDYAEATLADGRGRGDSLDVARVLLATGRVEQSVAMLRRLASANDAAKTAAATAEWTDLMREGLFAQLHMTRGDHAEAVASITPLLKSESHSTRLLLHQLRGSIARGDWTHAADFAIELALRDDVGMVDVVGYKQTPATAAIAVLDEAGLSDGGAIDSQRRDRFLAALHRAIDDADEVVRHRAVAALAGLPLRGSLWREQARWHTRHDRLAEAEAALLRAAADDASAPAASLALTRLYEDAGRPREAAAAWNRLLSQSPGFVTATGLRVAELAESLPTGSIVTEELARLQTDARPNVGTTISFESHADADWTTLYRDDRRKMRLTGSTLDVVDRPDDDEHAPNTTTLYLVDAIDGRAAGTLRVPKHYWHPPGYGPKQAGLFAPLGASKPVGISLLTGRTLWTAGDAVHSTRKFKVAHAGPQIVVLQDRNRLLGLRSTTGRVAWSRDDLDRQSGLMASESCGASADDAQTILFDSDGRRYRRFSTATGATLGGGRIEPDGRPIHRPELIAAHRLLYAAYVDGRWRMRAVDVSTDQPRQMLDEAASSRVLAAAASDHLAVLVNADRELVAFDLAVGEQTLRAPATFDPLRSATLTAAATSTELLVNAVPTISPRPTHYALTSTDLRLPHTNVDGTLDAYDRTTGERLWSHDLGKATLLDTFETELPVLLVLRRVRPQPGGARRMTLDVIDRRSGDIVAQHAELPRTPILRWHYDARRREAKLLGREATVTVQLGGPVHTVSR